jgi:methyl-accepting chemotaxis protein
MDRVTQSNAAGAEESASAAQELNAQAENMRMAVADLLAMIGHVRNSDSVQISMPTPKPRATMTVETHSPAKLRPGKPLGKPAPRKTPASQPSDADFA